MKLLYFHVPKTAGSSINHFFSKNLKKCTTHIESKVNLDKNFCEKHEFISGHVPYNRMQKMLNLDEWITFATFREPVSYVVSHLKWVRKLADPGEEERLRNHPEIFQKIALKMTEFDFANPQDITRFIAWLESINFYYFHSTQMHYMNATKNQGQLNKKQIEIALKNLSKINFIGIQEKMNEFMEMISYEFGWELSEFPKENINDNHYGFNINCTETVKALYPLYKNDILLYAEAKKQYEEQKKLYARKPIENVIGFVDAITASKIRGWVRSKNSLQKVELELKINGQCVQTKLANHYRKGLKIKKIHPSGLCGFQFILNKNIDYKNCKVYVKHTDVQLPVVKSAREI
jgi:hypothetical protein